MGQLDRHTRVRKAGLDGPDFALYLLAWIDEYRDAIVRPRRHVVVLALQLVVNLARGHDPSVFHASAMRSHTVGKVAGR